MAGKEGKLFEADVKNSIRPDVFYYRIKDPAQSCGRDSRVTRFSLKNECDCFIFKKPVLVAAELKSNQSTSISLSRSKEEKGKDIKWDQIQFLTFAKMFDLRAGFLLNYRKTENTYWIEIDNFNKFLEENCKKSINEEDLVKYDAVLVNSKKLRTRFRYDLSFLWEGD